MKSARCTLIISVTFMVRLRIVLEWYAPVYTVDNKREFQVGSYFLTISFPGLHVLMNLCAEFGRIEVIKEELGDGLLDRNAISFVVVVLVNNHTLLF